MKYMGFSRDSKELYIVYTTAYDSGMPLIIIVQILKDDPIRSRMIDQ
jgi:hypothetical protein